MDDAALRVYCAYPFMAEAYLGEFAWRLRERVAVYQNG